MRPSAASPKPLRVTIAVSSLRAGGAERVAAWLAGGLAGRGYQTTLLLLCGPQEPQAYALDPRVCLRHADIFWPSGGLRRAPDMLARLLRLRSALATTQPEVLVSFLDTVNVRVLLSSLGLGLPTAVSERIDPRQHPLATLWRLVRRLLYPRADALIIQTEGLREAWPRAWQRLIRVIPNPVLRLEPAGTVVLPPRTVLCAARLEPQKGLDLLLRAFARIAGEVDAHLTLLGEGSLRGELTRLAGELGVAERVRLPGVVSDVGAWLQAADAFALASHYEGQPNALAEAMATGLPCVATDTPGARSLLCHATNGLLVPRGDETALASALRRLLTDRDEALRLGAAARLATHVFSETHMLDLWSALVTELAGDRRSEEV